MVELTFFATEEMQVFSWNKSKYNLLVRPKWKKQQKRSI